MIKGTQQPPHLQNGR